METHKPIRGPARSTARGRPHQREARLQIRLSDNPTFRMWGEDWVLGVRPLHRLRSLPRREETSRTLARRSRLHHDARAGAILQLRRKLHPNQGVLRHRRPLATSLR